MKDKLKTLKDIYDGSNNWNRYTTLYANLQEAARGWIKETHNINYENDVLIDWIKHFFNLEEER